MIELKSCDYLFSFVIAFLMKMILFGRITIKTFAFIGNNHFYLVKSYQKSCHNLPPKNKWQWLLLYLFLLFFYFKSKMPIGSMFYIILFGLIIIAFFPLFSACFTSKSINIFTSFFLLIFSGIFLFSFFFLLFFLFFLFILASYCSHSWLNICVLLEQNQKWLISLGFV